MAGEDLERLCLVCRTPGHKRPVAALSLCYSCHCQATNRSQAVAAYVAGDYRGPPATPRATFGLCRMACDALACGGGYCSDVAGSIRAPSCKSRPRSSAFRHVS